jgi:hypothetical protein
MKKLLFLPLLVISVLASDPTIAIRAPWAIAYDHDELLPARVYLDNVLVTNVSVTDIIILSTNNVTSVKSFKIKMPPITERGTYQIKVGVIFPEFGELQSTNLQFRAKSGVWNLLISK